MEPLISPDLPEHRTGVDGTQRIGRRAFAHPLGTCGMVLLLALASGCGDQRLDVSSVQGRVVYKGKGVPQAVVIFHPSDDAAEQARKMRPFAYADDEGNFQLKTYIDGDGAPPGEYRVSIIARSSSPRGRRSKDGPAVEATPTGPTVNIPPELSKRYGNVDTSGIKVTVHEGENVLEPFVL